MFNVSGIVIDKDFEGPSLEELVPIIDEITEDPIKISWGNTHDEVALLHFYSNKRFTLYVDGFPAKDRAVAALGLALDPPQPVLDKAKDALNNVQKYDWRNFCDESKGGPAPKWLILKLAADSLRKGNRPALAEIISPVLLDGISIVDVDVLLRLRLRNGK
jgi:hypothetical protein